MLVLLMVDGNKGCKNDDGYERKEWSGEANLHIKKGLDPMPWRI